MFVFLALVLIGVPLIKAHAAGPDNPDCIGTGCEDPVTDTGTPTGTTGGGVDAPPGTSKNPFTDTALYKPLVTLPGATTVGQPVSFSTYVIGIYDLAIATSFVLAIIMIVVGGLQYMTSSVVTSKEDAKKRIWGAIWGLFLIISSYLILYTINPDLVGFSLNTGLPSAPATTNTVTYPPCSNNAAPSQPMIYLKYDGAKCTNGGQTYNEVTYKTGYADSAAGLQACMNDQNIYANAVCLDHRSPTSEGWYIKITGSVGTGADSHTTVKYFGPYDTQKKCTDTIPSVYTPGAGTKVECVQVENPQSTRYCVDVLADGRFYKKDCFPTGAECDAKIKYWQNAVDDSYAPGQCFVQGANTCLNLSVVSRSNGVTNTTPIQPPDCWPTGSASCSAKTSYWQGIDTQYTVSGTCRFEGK